MTDNDNRPWLGAYPEGIPAEIDPGGYSSLKALMERSFERFASEPAFSNAGTQLSYAEMDELSRHFAAFLQARGLKRGDPHRHNDAQPAAVPRGGVRGVARGPGRGQRQPALHAAGNSSTSSGTAAPGPSSYWRTSPTPWSRSWRGRTLRR